MYPSDDEDDGPSMPMLMELSDDEADGPPMTFAEEYEAWDGA